MKDVLRAALAVPALKVADVSFNIEQIQKRIDEAAEKIRAIDLNTLTPIEAMNLLFDLKRMLKN